METKNQCLKCGKPINLEDYDEQLDIPQLMKENQWCFTCAFWYNRYKQDKKIFMDCLASRVLITPDYNHYIIHLETLFISTGTFRGHFLESTEVCVAFQTLGEKATIHAFNNWSCQGTIPEHCRELFTPNGVFITPEQLKDWRNRKSFTSVDLRIYIDSIINKK